MKANDEKYKTVTIITGRRARLTASTEFQKIKCAVEELLKYKNLKYFIIHGDGGFQVLLSSRATRR